MADNGAAGAVGGLVGGAAPVKILGLSGRPPKNASTFLARSRPQLAAKWVRSCRRALRHLNDPTQPINSDWIKLFNSLGDRLGYPRTTEQRVDQTSITATVGADSLMASLAQRARALEQHFGRPLPALLSELDGDDPPGRIQ